MIIYCIAMTNSILPYERDPIPQDKEPPLYVPETIGSNIIFGFSMTLGCFFYNSCHDMHLAKF